MYLEDSISQNWEYSILEEMWNKNKIVGLTSIKTTLGQHHKKGFLDIKAISVVEWSELTRVDWSSLGTKRTHKECLDEQKLFLIRFFTNCAEKRINNLMLTGQALNRDTKEVHPKYVRRDGRACVAVDPQNIFAAASICWRRAADTHRILSTTRTTATHVSQMRYIFRCL